MSCLKIGPVTAGTHKHNTRRALIVRRARAMAAPRKEPVDVPVDEAADAPPPENAMSEVDMARVFSDIEFDR